VHRTNFNGTQAAINSGYSKKTAGVQASQLLNRLRLKTRIAELKAEQTKRLQMTADEVLIELSAVAKADIRKAFNADGSLLPINEIPEDIAKAIAGIDIDDLFEGIGEDREQVGFTKKVRLFNKIQALRDLGEHFGLFKGKDSAGVTIINTMGTIKINGKALELKIG